MKQQAFNTDCMVAMKEFPDKFFDLAVVDPPYGISAASKGFIRKGTQTGKSLAVSGTRYSEKDWDSSAPNREYFNELIRVSKNQIIWGANHFIEEIPNANSSCWIVWHKVTGDNN
jgi:site-specific DNA-methyltransferase (adenine-specific)